MIYSRSTHYCRLGTVTAQPGENFEAHPRRPASLAAELLQGLQEMDRNSAQPKSQWVTYILLFFSSHTIFFFSFKIKIWLF